MSGLRRPKTSVIPKAKSTVPPSRGINRVDGRNVIPHPRVKPAPTDLEVKIGKMVAQRFSTMGNRIQPFPVRAYRVSCAKPAPKSRFILNPHKATLKVDPDLKMLNDLIAKRRANPGMPYSARQEAQATRSWLEHKNHYGVDAMRVKSKPIKIQQSLSFDDSLRKARNRQAPDYAFSREEFDLMKTQEQKSQRRSPGLPYKELSSEKRVGVSSP